MLAPINRWRFDWRAMKSFQKGWSTLFRQMRADNGHFKTCMMRELFNEFIIYYYAPLPCCMRSSHILMPIIHEVPTTMFSIFHDVPGPMVLKESFGRWRKLLSRDSEGSHGIEWLFIPTYQQGRICFSPKDMTKEDSWTSERGKTRTSAMF
jgi:hypothetical protein